MDGYNCNCHRLQTAPARLDTDTLVPYMLRVVLYKLVSVQVQVYIGVQGKSVIIQRMLIE